MASQCVSEGTLDLSAAKQAIDFFRNYCDRCHQEKEEKLLFPLIEARGLVGEDSPVERMLYERLLGRQYLDALTAATETAASGDPDALSRFVYRARDYCYWLRGHISKEDQRLFPLATDALSENDQTVLLHSLQRAEAREMSSGAQEEYLHLANELADRFHVPRANGEGEGDFVCMCCGLSFHP
jgi:hemerythrin-like domain-containing protein